jgi:sugar lactone lactonase YvrE
MKSIDEINEGKRMFSLLKYSLSLLLLVLTNSCKTTQYFDWQNGTIYRFAGTGEPGYSGDGGPACSAKLNGPARLAIDKEDNVYVADLINCVVRKIDNRTGIIMTIAGSGQQGYEGDGGPAKLAKLNRPEGIFVDDKWNIFIADSGNHCIRKVDNKTGIIKTIAGIGQEGFEGDDGKAEKAILNHPAGVVVDSCGNIYFNYYRNDRIRKIDNQGIISTYAGAGVPEYSGDGGPADQAAINDVYGLAIDKKDNLYLIDSLNFAVRKIDAATGIIFTLVGKGKPGPVIELSSVSESFLGGRPHPKGSIGSEVPHAIEIDFQGNLFIGETGTHRIRMIHKGKQCLLTVAGSGKPGWKGDHGPARQASLEVHGLRIDSKGRLYFVDYIHHIIRMIEFSQK